MSVNQKSLTLEQVVSKRRKVVMDMDANVLADFTRSLIQDEAWAMLGEVDMKSVSDYLESLLDPLHSQEAEYCNRRGNSSPRNSRIAESLIARLRPAANTDNADANLGDAINDAVYRANAVRGWAKGLKALAALCEQDVAELLTLGALDLADMSTNMSVWDGLGGLLKIGNLRKLGLGKCKLGAAGLKRLAVELATAPLLEELELEKMMW